MSAKEKIELREPLWEQQGGESSINYKAFGIYRDMGWNEELEPQKRSIEKVSKRLGKSEALLSKWSSRFSWVKRVEAYDTHLNRKKTEQLEKERLKSIEEMRKRHKKAAVNMQTMGLEMLENIEFDRVKLNEIVSLLELGIEQERIAAGDTERSENNVNSYGTVHIYIPDNGRQR